MWKHIEWLGGGFPRVIQHNDRYYRHQHDFNRHSPIFNRHFSIFNRFRPDNPKSKQKIPRQNSGGRAYQ